MLREPCTAQDPQGHHQHGPGSSHVQTVHIDQGQQYPLLEDVGQPDLPHLQMA